MAKLALDAGHGINTAGKRLPKALDPKETREWTLNNRVVLYIIEILKDYENLEILRLDDPTGKINVPLVERTTLANNWKADLLMSVHHNAAGKIFDGGGIAVYAQPNAQKMSYTVQKALYNELIKLTDLKGNRADGTPTKNLHMTRESKMPAILSENGFMDSRVDYKIILTDEFARRVARAHANVVISHFGLKKVSKPLPPPPQPSKQLYRVQVGAYRVLSNAEAMEKRLKADKFDTYMIQSTSGIYRVQTGAFSIRDNALALERKLKSKGYATYLTTNAVNDAAPDEKVEEESISSPVQKPKSKKIDEDGKWGAATTKLAQEVYKMKAVDSIISGQPRNASTLNIPAAQFGSQGSALIREMQKEFGTPKSMHDGKISADSRLVRAMQKYYKTPQDGKISYPSMVVKEWQKALNKGKRK